MKFRHLLTGVFVSLALLSCGKDDQDSIGSGENGNNTFLPMDDITVHPLGDALTMSYTSQYAWKVDCDCDWLKVTESGKAGTTKVTIEVDPNIDQTREVTIRFLNNSVGGNRGDELDSFVVKQYEAVLGVAVDRADKADAETFEYKTDGKEKVVFDWKRSREGAGLTVESNIEWKINIAECDYLLQDGNTEVLSAEYGDVVDDPVVKPFRLSAKKHNLSAGDNPVTITVTPRKVGTDNNELELSQKVIEHLSKTVTVSQEFLLFYLEGEDNSGFVADGIDVYGFENPFTELGNDYLSQNTSSDTAPGAQTFYLVYEKGKVEFEEGSWGEMEYGSQPCVLNNGHMLECVGTSSIQKRLKAADSGEDETEVTRDCVRKKIRLIVPEPNKDKLLADVDDESNAPTPYSVELPLKVGGEVVSNIILNYSQNRYELFLSNAGGEFSNLGGDQEKKQVQVRTKGPWKLETSGDWLTIQDTGAQTATVSLYAPAQNLNFKDNEASLTLSTNFDKADPELVDGNHPKFTQKPFVFDINRDDIGSDKSISRLDKSGYTIVLDSYGPWTLKTTPASDGKYWLDVKAVGSGQTIELKDGVLNCPKAGEWTITVNANHTNETTSYRKMGISITSDYHASVAEPKAKKDFSITQDPYSFNVRKDGKSIADSDVPMLAYRSPEYVFDIECGGPWRIVEKPTWVTVSGSTEGDGSSYEQGRGIKVSVDGNTGENWNKSRSGKIKVRSYRSEMELPAEGQEVATVEDIEFEIVQDAFVFDVEVDPAYTVGAIDKDTRPFKVRSTSQATWRVVSDYDWVVLSSKNGTGNGSNQSLTFKLNENGTLEGRTSTVTVSSLIVDKSVTFEVTQGAYRFDSTTESLDKFAELDKTSRTFNVDCLGPWSVRNKPSWITLSKSSGNGSDGLVEVTVTASDNHNDDREGSFEVYSNVGGVTHTKTINVSQKDFVWAVTENPGSVHHEALQADIYDLKFKSSGAWEAKLTGSDIDGFPVVLSEYSGDGGRDNEEVVNITVPANYRKSQRNVSVVVTSKDDNTKKHTVAITQDDYKFSLGSKSKSDCEVLGDSFTIPVNCTGDWAVELGEAEETYLNVSPVSGTGNGVVSVTVSPNYQPQLRNGNINIVTKDASALKEPFTLTQAKYVFGLTGVPSTEFTAEAKEFGFGVDCSGNWKVELDADAQQFLSVSNTEDRVTVNAPLNTAASPRSGKITVSSTDNPELKQVVSVSQDGYIWNVSNAGASSFDAKAASFNIAVSCTGGWKVSEKSDFLTVGDMTGNGSKSVSVAVSLNKDAESRDGKVVLVSTDNPEFTETIEISQAGYVFDAVNVGASSFDAKAASFNIAVSCTGGWKVSEKSDFLTVGDMTGNGDKTVSVAVSLNKNAEARDGKVVLVSTDNPAFTKTIAISQAGYVWAVDAEDSYDVATLGGSFKIGVTCTNGWKVTLDADAQKFITVNQASGTGNFEISFTAALNAGAARSGKITVASTDNPAFTKTVTVSQGAYSWQITADSMSAVPAAGGTYSVKVDCTGDWKVALDADAQKFVKVNGGTSATGKGNGTVSVTVSSNKKAAGSSKATAERNGVITVSTTDGSSKTHNITIKQAGEK